MEVEEHDIDAQGNVLKSTNNGIENENRDIPMIRDSSRNRLQRLGALYSDTENLSSPIHRNEARFDDNLQASNVNDLPTQSRPIKRIGKLAALADSINNWEDDLSHSDTASGGKSSYRSVVVPENRSPKKQNSREPQVVATTLRKTPLTKTNDDRQVKSILSPNKNNLESIKKSSSKVTANTAAAAANDSNKNSSKQLKWDQHVMDALEQQGFQRRESSTSKLTYNFKDNRELTARSDQKSSTSSVESPKKPPPKVDVSKGLVSDRAALFENSQKSGSPIKTHKDPTELSIKERLALFEKNKGNALIPKAALGMAPSAKQIQMDQKNDEKILSSAEKQKINNFNKSVFAETNAAGNSIRSTVAALMLNATTLSESQIAADIRKQREKEMNVLLNRFNQPVNEIDFATNVQPPPTAASNDTNKSKFGKSKAAPPPPAPPLPPSPLVGTISRHSDAKHNIVKRKSNGKYIFFFYMLSFQFFFFS